MLVVSRGTQLRYHPVVEIIKSPTWTTTLIPVAERDVQLEHLKRWKFTLLHLQHNFLRCSHIVVSPPTFIIFIVRNKAIVVTDFLILHKRIKAGSPSHKQLQLRETRPSLQSYKTVVSLLYNQTLCMKLHL